MLSFPDFKEKQLVIVFGNEGHRINIKNDNITVTDKEGSVLIQNSCYTTFSIWIIGNTTLSSNLLQKAQEHGFSIQLLSYGLKPIGTWASTTDGNILLRETQYEYNKLDLAKHLTQNKLQNQSALLKSIRKKDAKTKTAILKIDNYHKQILGAKKLDEIMGYEGSAAKLFFNIWFKDQEWKSREPRTKSDPINVLLDMGYTYLFYFVESMLNLYGFDIYKGVLHTKFHQRKSLVCDLVEPFRCIIDHQIKTAYNLKQIKPDDFIQEQSYYLLPFKNAKPYTKLLTEAILSHKSDIFLYIQSYYRQFMKNAPIENYPIFTFEPKGNKKC